MTTSLRSRLSEPGAVVALGAHDGLTARIAERAGIEAIYHGGYATAAHHFGLPDVGLVGRAEVVESVRRMRAATELPIVVDADTGYGSEAGVWLTVRELEAVGAERDPDRGPGLAEALRPHGGEGGDPRRGDGDQGARGRRRAALRGDADHRPLGRAPGDGPRRRDRPLQRLRRGGRRPRLRRRAPHRRGVRGDRRAVLRARASRTCRRRGARRRSRRRSSRRWATSSSSSRARRPGSSRRPTRSSARRSSATGRPRRSRDRFTSFDDVNALLGLAEWQSR